MPGRVQKIGMIPLRRNARESQMLDDLRDLEFIEKFEEREKKGKVKFFSAEEILKKVK